MCHGLSSASYVEFCVFCSFRELRKVKSKTQLCRRGRSPEIERFKNIKDERLPSCPMNYRLSAI